jgi:hypothetical protein
VGAELGENEKRCPASFRAAPMRNNSWSRRGPLRCMARNLRNKRASLFRRMALFRAPPFAFGQHIKFGGLGKQLHFYGLAHLLPRQIQPLFFIPADLPTTAWTETCDELWETENVASIPRKNGLSRRMAAVSDATRKCGVRVRSKSQFT